MCFADMYLEIFLADFAVFRVFLGISRDFAEIPEFRGSATANYQKPCLRFGSLFIQTKEPLSEFFS